MPLIGVFILAMFWFIPKIAVFKQNLKAFENNYYMLQTLIVSYFLLFYSLTLLPNFGIQFNMTTIAVFSVGILMMGVGVMIPKFKRNFFAGIRTP